MIRKIIKPQKNQIVLNIPESYINKEIKLIIFPLNENSANSHTTKNRKSLKGVFNKYADNSKVSLENRAWQKHIIDKYK